MAFTTFQLETPALASGVWELARPAEFSDDVQPAVVEFSDVSCASPGNCTAVGSFRNSSGGDEAFTMTSTNGVWAFARPAQFDDDIQNETPDAEFRSVSCASPGNCTAVGDFVNHDGVNEPFTMTSTNGEWETARPAQFEDGDQFNSAVLQSVSCASSGNCTAVGTLFNGSTNEAFTMTSTNGEWETARRAQFEADIQSESPSPNFEQVSCASPGYCTAVGWFYSQNGSRAFTMTLTDGEWELARLAEFGQDIQNESPYERFYSVSCASPGNCTAVGFFRNSSGGSEAFTMTLTDGEWQTARPAEFEEDIQNESPSAGFNSVSCTSSRNCTAVGDFVNHDGVRRAFTMTLAAGEWETARPAEFEADIQGNVDGQGMGTYFRSVSCASSKNCTAVGEFTNHDGDNEPFTMTSTNGEWGLAQPAQFADGVQFDVGGFYSVSCATPGNCTAVGNFWSFSDDTYTSDAFTMTSSRESPPPSNEPGLARPAQFAEGVQFEVAGFRSVSCATPGNCTTVGSFKNSNGGFEAFTMTSTNGEWEIARPAEFGQDIQNESPYASFNSVSCATPGNCTAVGTFRNSSGGDEAFTMTLTDGEWELARPAQFEDDIQNESPSGWFNSVSCATPGNCTAVGTFRNSSGDYAFTMTSTNGEWALARPAQFTGGIQPVGWFSDVSCASSENCTAVGSFFSGTDHSEALTMTSTNGVWALARPAEFEDDIQNESPTGWFNSVSCATPGNCTAVGKFFLGTDHSEALTMTSTNGVWALARPAEYVAGLPDPQWAGFYSVSCATPGNCTAVGYFENSNGGFEAFTMTLTDGEWENARPVEFEEGIQNTRPYGVFDSVSCASPGNCTAVGRFRNSSGDREAFTMTSTNSVWGLARPAQFADGVQNEAPSAAFNSVSCASLGNCTAVGSFRNISGDRDAFTMTTEDDTYSSQSDSAPTPTTTAPSPTTTAPSPTTTAPSPTTTAPSPTDSQPKRATKGNTLKVAPAKPAESTSTSSTISEDAAQTTPISEPQTPSDAQSGHGSLGWWILGGSSIIGGSFIISAWWITHSLRRFQITKPSAVSVNS